MDFHAGQASANGAANAKKVAEEIPAEWQVVKVDLCVPREFRGWLASQ